MREHVPVTTPGDLFDRRALQLMSVGFGIGSILFAAGGIMSVLARGPANGTFAVGAVCFTVSALVQWRVAVRHHPRYESLRRRAETDVRNPDWLSAVIQLVGTLYFNAMTIRALSIAPADAGAYNSRVWVPDALGSFLFLMSSLIALHPVSRERRHRLLRGRSAAIVWANVVGSVFFGISAVGAFAFTPGQLTHPGWNNWGTTLGGMSFLVGSVLLWPRPVSKPARHTDS